MNNKIFIAFVILLVSTTLILFLWNRPILLSLLLVFTAILKHKLFPIKKELLWYVITSVSGAVIEIVLVNLSGAWSYKITSFMKIPFYMPLFWGVVSTTIIVIYDALISSKK